MAQQSTHGVETSPHITVKSKSTVLPASPSTAGRLFLSAMDIMWQDIHYNKRVIFYHSPAPAEDAIETLTRSLSDVLVHYYPWAGRIATDEDGRLVIDCNDTGVEFVEAAIDFSITHLAEQGFQMKPWYEQLCRKLDHLGNSLYTSPLLAVQATRFSDGGLAVGITQSHVVADGQSLWNFLVGWGECARKVELSVKPLHDRRRLALTRSPSEEKAKGFSLDLQMKPEDYEDLKNGHDVSAAEADTSVQLEHKGLVQCVFELSGENIAKLKAEAGGGFTSYEVMCAHFWQRTTAARRLPPKTLISFSVLANCRNRVTPPLPPSYFGNVITFAFSGTTAGRICSESLRSTVERVHETAARAGNCTEAQIHWLELRGNRMIPYFRPTAKKWMSVASSPRFPSYKVDFGWGVPSAVRSAKVPGDGEMVLFGGRPGSSPGDVEICFALPEADMRRLLNDPAFLAKTHAPPVFSN